MIAAAPPSRRARVLAGLSLGYLRAGRAERARALFALAPPPDDQVTATDQALYLLRDGRPAEARARLARFAARGPARALLGWINDPASALAG